MTSNLRSAVPSVVAISRLCASTGLDQSQTHAGAVGFLPPSSAPPPLNFMKHPIVLRRVALLFLCTLATSAIGFGWWMTPGNPSSEALKAAMAQMDESLKVLGKGVTEENRAASLEELAKFQTAVLAAKALTPDSASKVEEKKQAAFVGEYRKTLISALELSCAAETSIVDGKYKDADSLIRNKLSAAKSKGHGKFKTDGGY